MLHARGGNAHRDSPCSWVPSFTNRRYPFGPWRRGWPFLCLRVSSGFFPPRAFNGRSPVRFRSLASRFISPYFPYRPPIQYIMKPPMPNVNRRYPFASIQALRNIRTSCKTYSPQSRQELKDIFLPSADPGGIGSVPEKYTSHFT